MSFFRSSWREVYFGIRLEEYFSCLNKLRSHGIAFKTKRLSNSFRASFHSGRTSVDAEDYLKIYVRENDEYQARKLIEEVKNK